jgi:hypothetical protein
MKSFLSQGRTFRELERYLHNDQWMHLKGDLATSLRLCRPICFYLDAVDEFYEAAPQPWLSCQAGLFFAIMELLRDERFGGRLHIFAALRDAVILRVVRSEHGLRHLHERYVRILEWDRKSIMLLLEQKIENLDAQLKRSLNSKAPVERWLGRSVQRIPTRNRDEPITQYLLRHTRLLPRDIIIMGNILCTEMAREHWFPEMSSDADPIRDGVRAASINFGNELLSRCASYLMADMMPDDAIRDGYESVYLEKTAGLHNAVVKDLQRFLRSEAKFERVSARKLGELSKKGAGYFGKEVDIIQALWLNGLIGYLSSGEQKCSVFYSHRDAGDLQMPMHRQTYLFHSCLIDSVGIRAKGASTVQCP